MSDNEYPSTSWAKWAWQAYREGRLVEALPPAKQDDLASGKAVTVGVKPLGSDGVKIHPQDILNAAWRDDLGEEGLAMYDRILAALEPVASPDPAAIREAALLPWAKLGVAVMEGWPEGGDIDGFDLQDMAVAAGVLREVEGGFDPEQHEDSTGYGAEPGDRWFLIANVPEELKGDDHV